MRGLARIHLGKKELACEDLTKAKNLGLTQVEKEIERNCR
jgi:hypothetical protein